MAISDFSVERWVFTQAEWMNPLKCRRNDQFVAQPCGTKFALCGIMVDRTGKATNGWSDGGVGVSFQDRAAAEAEESLTQLSEDHNGRQIEVPAETWLDVVVDKNGYFVQFWTGVVEFEIHEIRTTRLMVRADTISEAIAIATVGPLNRRLIKEEVVQNEMIPEVELVFIKTDHGNHSI